MRALFGAGCTRRRRDGGRGPLPCRTKLGVGVSRLRRPGAVRPASGGRSRVAFTQQNGRPPSETERNQIAAKEARRGRRAVAGFDLVFTPVKSASLLWALGGPEVRKAVEDAHHDAVPHALAWIETHAAYTRTGRGGPPRSMPPG